MPNPLISSPRSVASGIPSRYHFSVSTSSTFAVPRFRKTRRMMPSARPTSAAAMVITKIGEDDADEERRRRVDREGHEVDAHGVEHQLDRHQDQHRVAARQHAVDADRKQDRAETNRKCSSGYLR